MRKFEINGRAYNLRDYLTLGGYDRLVKADKAADSLPEDEKRDTKIYAQLFEMLLRDDGTPYPSQDAMLDDIAILDYFALAKHVIAAINGELPDGEAPLPPLSERNTA